MRWTPMHNWPEKPNPPATICMLDVRVVVNDHAIVASELERDVVAAKRGA
jgi:hypothetical protein